VVVTAFDTYRFPVTYSVVDPDEPVSVAICKLLVDETFRVVLYTNGIVNVSKLKFVFVVVDVNPEAIILVVVTVFDTYKFPTT